MGVDTRVRIGSVDLSHAVMTAAGTSGHGAELSDFGDLGSLGAVVVKSLAAFAWPGNPAPRLHPLSGGMLNAVGLQGPGIGTWASTHLEDLDRCGARVVISIWGRSPEEYERACEMIAELMESSAHARNVVAVEVNLSCPNLSGHGIISHDCATAAEVIRRCKIAPRPLWAKLSPNSDRIVDSAKAVRDSGAEAVTLVNTVSGLVLDEVTGLSVLGNGAGGGISGRVIHPIAVKAIHDVRSAMEEFPIVGVGGVSSPWDAVELLLAGASAVQVGTATFADPRAPFRVADGLVSWAAARGVERLADLSGLAHRGGLADLVDPT